MNSIVKSGARSLDIERTYEANYPAFQYAFVQFFSEHLADCSREFNGDLQQMLLLAVIGQVALDAHMRGPSTPERSSRISASRLADVCGIPRETVRRKLKLLESKGWIRKVDEQNWSLPIYDGDSKARQDLGPLERRGIVRIARMVASLERLSLQIASHSLTESEATGSA